ncbi:MAG: hypothetical protein MK101_05650 [Phycisphaerales bacterium]|nr:hypothetical protein [Phycisphaerales bacterium]
MADVLFRKGLVGLSLVALALSGVGCSTPPQQVELQMSMADTSATGMFTRQVVTSSDEVLWATSEPFLTEEDIDQVRWTVDATGAPALSVRLTEAAAADMRSTTSANIGRRMLIEIDCEPVSAPRVMSSIGGEGLITGDGASLATMERFAAAMGAAPRTGMVPGKGLRPPR